MEFYLSDFLLMGSRKQLWLTQAEKEFVEDVE